MTAKPTNRRNVMNERKEDKASLDDFPTPPWATRYFLDYTGIGAEGGLIARDPCANRGYMVEPLKEVFAHVDAFDIANYGAGFPIMDYTKQSEDTLAPVDWTIMNPPFNRLIEFVLMALKTSRRGVVCLARTSALEAENRYDALFKNIQTRPTAFYQSVERIPMHKGRVFEGAGTATAYGWYVWNFEDRAYRDETDTLLRWLPPAKKKYERPEDYVQRGSRYRRRAPKPE